MKPTSESPPSRPLQPDARSDEVTLRDLYLVFKRGLPLILLASLLAAALVYLYSARQDPVYEAESTTVITPPPLSVQSEDSISFLPPGTVSFEAYETLALSRPVFEGALARLPELDMSVSALRGASHLERLLGPQRPDQVAPLSMSHRVRHSDPEASAALSNAWAESTLATIRASLLAGLDPVDAATGEEIATLRARLDEAEAAWEGFQERHTVLLLETRLERLTTAIAEAELGLVTLPESAAPSLSWQLGGVGWRQLTPQLSLGAEIAATRAQLEQLQEEGEEAGEETGGEAGRETTVRALQARLAGLEARRELLPQQLEGYYQELEATRAELARVTRQRDALQRDRDNARAAYQTIVQLQPTIAYVTQLAPLSARVLSEASVPESTVGPRPLMNAVLALLAVAALATLAIFLREAVAGPPAAAPARAHAPLKTARRGE